MPPRVRKSSYMNNITNRLLLRIFTLLLLLFSLHCYGQTNDFENKEYPTTPMKKNEIEKWRIGYLEGGPFPDYQMNLIAIVKGLMELGWIEKMNIPSQQDPKDTKALWQWLANDINSEYIEFVADAYWSANWGDSLRKEIQQTVLTRLTETGDIDLMLALGTWAGQDLANDKHTVPTVAASVADALEANIIKSIDDSGYDHLHAKIDPTRNKRQLQLFHDIINFSRLGVVYENSTEGRSYAAINDVEIVAKERKFQVIPCYANFSNNTLDAAQKEVIDCYIQLAESVDAIYITRHRGLTPEVVEKIMVPLNRKRLKTFSQQGSRDVKLGVLLSIALATHKYVGNFYAETIAKIFNGALPRHLPQLFEEPPKIAINIKTANLIKFDPPIELFGIADEIYQ